MSVNTTVVARCSSSTHHRSPAYGRTCSDQPSGENHDRVPVVASPTARSAKATPSAPNAIPRAVRAPVLSCAATAATAENTRPEPASARPKASEPAGGTSVVSRPAVPINPVAMDAPNASISAAVRLA